MKKDWELIRKKEVFPNKWRPVEEWRMRTYLGKEVSIFVTRNRDVVVIFGITDEKRILILKQYYYVFQKKVHALVAGFVDSELSNEETAAKELREEAGCKARELVHLGSVGQGKYVTGYTHFYCALGVEKIYEQELEAAEDIEVSFVSLDEFMKLLRGSELHDIYGVSGAYWALDYLKEHKII